MHPSPLNNTATQVWVAIARFCHTHHRAPIYQDIGAELGIRVTTVKYNIDILVELGYMRRAGYGKKAAVWPFIWPPIGYLEGDLDA